MKELKERAQTLIHEFKGNEYIHGLHCLDKIGEITAPVGRNILLITSLNQRDPENYKKIQDSLHRSGIKIKTQTSSSCPNSPREDVFRMKEKIRESNPEGVVVASGGSGIDAAKAAIVLTDLGGDLEDYFGPGRVREKLFQSKKSLTPCIPVQTASGSGAHLTKYSNITDLKTYQKKLISDEAIVPPRSLFDYSLTQSMSPSFTCDGAFDGLSHCLEAYYGAQSEIYHKIENVALTGIELILAYIEKAVSNPRDLEAREALGLATDLGGYAIMMGGTNAAHLNSFSLVDILSHGRACAILNPYYTVFFSSAIQAQLKRLAALFSRYGLFAEDIEPLEGRELGLAVAEGLIELSRRVHFPTTFEEIPGFTPSHIEKVIRAAQNPQLDMKLKNMPIALNSSMVETTMKPVLKAAVHGDFRLIPTIE